MHVDYACHPARRIARQGRLGYWYGAEHLCDLMLTNDKDVDIETSFSKSSTQNLPELAPPDDV